MRIVLFGGVSATTDGGQPLDIGPAKCQTLLAALALSAGSAVPVSRLVVLVWSDQPPRTAEKTLQSYVVRLRAGLGADSILRTGAAYLLAVPADGVDVIRFRRHLDSGNDAAALMEWTGTPLAGLDAHGLTPIVDGLVEQWLGAVETNLTSQVETDASRAIGPLTQLTADHPFREGFWSLLMTALYRVGRQADALAAFQHARQLLVEHLGVEPGQRLRDLESRILDQDDLLRGSAIAGPASDRPTGTVTFGFCQVEDAARLWATNLKKTAAAMARLDDLVRAAAHRHGGFLFVIGGDSFGAAFHRADDAAAWATELQLGVSTEPWPGGVELRLRIGLHTGETDEAANGYFGAAVNDAERLTSAGHGGQTLVSAVTAALLDRSQLPDLGAYRLDGDPAEQHIFQLGSGKHPALRRQHYRPGNIPVRLGRLIGRDQDLDVIAGALAQSPIVTLVGPGGIGKTRLALAAAQSTDPQRSGPWLIELASIASSGDVPQAVADTLGLKEHPGRTLTQSIVTALRSRETLIILDNCEHVIDGAAGLANAIAQGCPMVSVLATSRAALNIDDEQLLPVAPLNPAGSAAELFNERARAACPTFDAAAFRGDVEEICRRLDGIPLAIELAAARSKTLSPPDLVGRLGDRLDLLTGGRRTSPERHRTLRATIGWSYDMLTPPQQVLLRQLSIFAGPFDVAAASSVAPDHPNGTGGVDLNTVDDLLAELVDQSMLLVESGRFGRRFRLLETIRAFAAEQVPADDSVRIAGRHAQWCLHQVADIHRLLIGPVEAEGVARLAELWPNLRAGFDWACATGDRELADGLVRPVVGEVNFRQQTEISDWAERILTLTPPAERDAAAFWLVCVTYRCKQNGATDRYESLVHRYGDPNHPLVRFSRAYFYDDGAGLTGCAPEAVAWLRGNGDGHAAAIVETGGVAAGLMSTGRFGELDVLVSTLAARYRAHGPPTLLYVALSMLGYSALLQGEADLADRFFDEAASITVPDRTVSVNKPIEARAAFRRGNQSAAVRVLRAYINELIDNDYQDLATNAAVEFINIMATIDRIPAAARVLDYLAAAGDFGALTSTTLVADAAARIAANTDPERPPEPRLDARHALTYMRDELDKVGSYRMTSDP